MPSRPAKPSSTPNILNKGIAVNFLLRVSVLLLGLSLVACFSPADPPADAPANVSVTEGDGLVVVNWDAVAGRKYWIFYAEGSDASLDVYDRILLGVKPPYIITGLSNGSQYAFAVTSSQSGSKTGPFAPVLIATPRLLGPAIPWTIGASLSVNNLHGIAFGIDKYVTVGDAATLFVAPYSYPDIGGVTAWSQPTSLPIATSSNLVAVRYDGRRFIALADDGSVIKSTDKDALTWEGATSTGAGGMHAFAVGAGRYVAVGDGGAIYSNTSDAAASAWSEETSGTSNDLYGIAYVNSRFIAVGAAGTLLTSSDGVSWTQQTTNTSDNLRGVAYGADSYVAVGDAGAVVSSSDAVSWSAQSIPTTESFHAICFGPDQQFVAVGTAGVLAYSSTGLDGSWQTANAGSIDLNDVSPNLLFIAVGDAGANVSGK